MLQCFKVFDELNRTVTYHCIRAIVLLESATSVCKVALLWRRCDPPLLLVLPEK